MTAFNIICPDQKSFFNLQVLPVTSTMYDLGSKTPPPFEFIKLTTQFINIYYFYSLIIKTKQNKLYSNI